MEKGIDATTATVLAAAVGGGLAILGAVISAWVQLKLERARWPRARGEAIERELRELVQSYATSIAAAAHSMSRFTWSAAFDRHASLPELFDLYNVEMSRVLPRISGLLAAGAALDDEAFQRLRPIAKEVYRLDDQLGEVGLLIDEDPEEAQDRLERCFEEVRPLAKDVPRKVGEITRERLHAGFHRRS